MAQGRFDPRMTDTEIVLAMAGSNPGAIIACTELVEYAKGAADPEQGFGDVFETFAGLDRFRIWDESIALLWQICGYNVAKMIAVVKASLHKATGMNERVFVGAIYRARTNADPGIDLDAVVSAVREWRSSQPTRPPIT